MKNFKFLFSVAVASALIGCSSMDVEEEEALSENFPADFSKSEYMAIHPELLYLQYKDYIVNVNNAFKEAAGEAFEEKLAADQAAFEKNVDQLQALYLDPYVGRVLGYNEEEWAADMAGQTVDDTVTVQVYKINKDTTAEEKTYVVDETPLTVYLCDHEQNKIVAKKNAGISQLKGVIGEECTTENYSGVSINISDSTYKIVEGSFTTAPKKLAGGVPADKMKLLSNFNFYETTDDYKALQAVVIDTSAIVNQYVVFGRLHGWGYRKCTEAEKTNPALTEEYPTKKLYCDDNGTAREIKK